MVLTVQSIRFSKEHFADYESCATWIDKNDLSLLKFNELGSTFVFNQIDDSQFEESTLQTYEVAPGIEAMVGQKKSDAEQTLESVQDIDSPVIENNDTVAVEDHAITKENLDNFSSKLQGVAQTISILQNSLVEDYNLLMGVEKSITKNVEIIKTSEERIVFGEVLIPDSTDAQLHTYDAEEVKKAAHYWMKNFMQYGEMHDEMLSKGQVRVLESYVAPVSFSIEKSDGEKHRVKKGTWLLKSYIVDDDLWEKAKSGEFSGYSIGGVASVTPIEED